MTETSRGGPPATSSHFYAVLMTSNLSKGEAKSSLNLSIFVTKYGESFVRFSFLYLLLTEELPRSVRGGQRILGNGRERKPYTRAQYTTSRNGWMLSDKGELSRRAVELQGVPAKPSSARHQLCITYWGRRSGLVD
jgi:hypothetical protein